MAAIICNKIGNLSENPFCLYVTAAIGTNIGPIVVGAQAISSLGKCKGSAFCVGTMAFSIAHMVAAWYVASSVSNRANRQLADKTTAVSRATHMLCHDQWIAAYILVLIAFFCWLCVGVSWRVDGAIYNGGGCPYEIGSWVNTCIGCGFSFFSMCFYALILSLCMACCCDKNDYSAPETDEEAGCAYAQHHDNNPGDEQGGLGPGGQQASPTPLVPVPAPAGHYGSTENTKGGGGRNDNKSPSAPPPPPTNPNYAPSIPAASVAPASNPSYDPNLPMAVAVPVHDAKQAP